jgi:hypothetical protein
MDRPVIDVVTTETPSDAKEYWKSRTMEERLVALELTRQILNAYARIPRDFKEFLKSLDAHNARFLLIGGYAPPR